jgi:SNF2 family DNA or RNA helicase
MGTTLGELMKDPVLPAIISSGRIALKSVYVHGERIAEVPGARFHGKGQDYWSVPLSWTSLVCLTNTFGDVFQPSDELAQWANDYYSNVIEPCTLLRTGQGEGFIDDEMLSAIDALLPPHRSVVKPVVRRYQAAAALLLATAKRFALLDEQGTGKMTEVSMALSLYPDTLPALIVAPASTLYSWQFELAQFGIEADILDGTAVQRRKVLDKFETEPEGVLIVSYGLVSKHSRVAPYGNIKLTDEHRTPKEVNQIPWATVVADEVHRAKSPHTVQTRALWAVSDRAEYRWATTGTPIEGSPLDFWALLRFIDPESWPSSVKMRDRWVDYYENYFGGIEVRGIRSDRAEEWRNVTEWRWRRKLLDGLPPREEEFRYCELKGKHLKAYHDMKNQLMAETGEDDVVLFAENHMVKAGRLLQLASSFIETEYSTDDDGEEVVEVTPIEPSPKLDLFMDTLEDFEGEAVIAWFVSVKLMRLAQARLDKKGVDYVVIDGTMSAKARHEAVKAIQEGRCDLILISIAAGSEGVTLTRAAVSIHVQRPHSLIQDKQSIHRNWRIGSEQHERILAVHLVTKGTIEEDQYQSKIGKEEIVSEVLSPLAVS